MSTPVRKLALILNNYDYIRPANKLDARYENVKKLKDILFAMGFQVTSDMNIEDKHKMVESVNAWCDQQKENDLVLFYYFGHGCQVNNENYFVQTDDDFNDEGDVASSAISVSHIIERIRGGKESNVKMVILDCCRPYQFRNGSQATGLKMIEPSKQLFVQFACADGGRATDNFFSDCLLKEISTQMEIRELFKKICDEVRQKRNGEQEPLTMYDKNTLIHPVYLCELPKDSSSPWDPIDPPDIPTNAKWKPHAITIFKGLNGVPMKPGLSYPKGIWICGDDRTLVADHTNHRILERRPDETKREVVGTGVFGFEFDQLNFPTDVVFQESTQSFLICDYGNRRVSRWSPGKKHCDKIIVNNVACYGIAIDHDDNIYVSNKEKHEVRRYAANDRHGKIVAGGHGRGSRLNQLNGPTFISIGPEKALYISDSDNDRVVKWDLKATKGVIVAGGNDRGRKLSQLNNPKGVVADRNGTVYVVDQMNNRIMRWGKEAKFGQKIVGDIQLGEGSALLNGPEGLRFDRKRHLCVVDSYNHRVQRFEIVLPDSS